MVISKRRYFICLCLTGMHNLASQLFIRHHPISQQFSFDHSATSGRIEKYIDLVLDFRKIHAPPKPSVFCRCKSTLQCCCGGNRCRRKYTGDFFLKMTAKETFLRQKPLKDTDTHSIQHKKHHMSVILFQNFIRLRKGSISMRCAIIVQNRID